jgi:hypothetical protein
MSEECRVSYFRITRVEQRGLTGAWIIGELVSEVLGTGTTGDFELDELTIGPVSIKQIFTDSNAKETSNAVCAPDLLGATLFYGPQVIAGNSRASVGFSAPGIYGFTFKLGALGSGTADNPSKCVHLFGFFEETEGFSGNTLSPPDMNP